MKIILTNITGLSAGRYSLFLYNIFDVINSNENSYSIITNFGNDFFILLANSILFKLAFDKPTLNTSPFSLL